MLYAALATDYDGTIAHHGAVSETTLAKLRWAKERGKQLILVTGRELPDLQRVFGDIALFDAVVAENGALLFLPGSAETVPLGPPPPEAFVAALRAQGISPLSVGTAIVATWEPHQQAVLDAIRAHGLEWQIIFNKGAVMCLPPGINKASGLGAALAHLKLSPLNVIGVGDAENDHAFLTLCGFSVAVANALESVKAEADLVTAGDHGAGVEQLIRRWLEEADFGTDMKRHGAELGEADGAPVRLFAARHTVLISGTSGAGKSSLATAFVESVLETGAQLAVVDPEGDYDALEGIAHLGTPERAPSLDEAMALLDDPGASLVLGLLGVPLADRPAWLAGLLGDLLERRARHGRPHWLVLDETHHFLPAEANASAPRIPRDSPGLVFITLTPDIVAPDVLEAVNVVVAAGPEAAKVIAGFCALRGLESPPLPPAPGEDEAWCWFVGEKPPFRFAARESRAEHHRHVRKYAEGELGDKSFWFRGPEDALKLRARNLLQFLDLADGVDAHTWLHHLRQGDYSAWVREAVGDEELADELAAIERSRGSDAEASRAGVRAAIERRYTAPAG